jgi:hypothetical protein
MMPKLAKTRAPKPKTLSSAGYGACMGVWRARQSAYEQGYAAGVAALRKAQREAVDAMCPKETRDAGA